MSTSGAPGWARRPDVAGHVVTCVTCGGAMSWRAYLEHGPDCTPDTEDGRCRARPGAAEDPTGERRPDT